MCPKLWQCCQCNERPISIALHGSNCPGCNKHDRCGTCKVDKAIDPPSPRKATATTAMDDSAYHDGATFPPGPPVDLRVLRSVWNTAGIAQSSPRAKTAFAKGQTKLGSRPSMGGWWYCSECKAMNNPDLSSGRCTSCGHAKCARCRPCDRR
jgi:hypothetical protein